MTTNQIRQKRSQELLNFLSQEKSPLWRGFIGYQIPAIQVLTFLTMEIE